MPICSPKVGGFRYWAKPRHVVWFLLLLRERSTTFSTFSNGLMWEIHLLSYLNQVKVLTIRQFQIRIGACQHNPPCLTDLDFRNVRLKMQTEVAIFRHPQERSPLTCRPNDFSHFQYSLRTRVFLSYFGLFDDIGSPSPDSLVCLKPKRKTEKSLLGKRSPR